MLNPDVIINSQPLGRKILELHPDSGHENKNQKEKWFLMSNNETESDEIEEVYWKGNTVAVLSFDKHQNDFRLKNSFSVETEIKDVIYTDFHLDEKSSELSQCLCVLEKSCLNIFTEVGKLFIASLPFKVKKIWGISKGICAEREANSKDAEEEKGMPTLFSLAHPMEDFKPVVYHYLDNRKPMYFTDATQHIVFTSPKDSLIMTYDSVLGLHSVWKARKALEQDFPEVLSHQDSLPEFGMMNQSSQLGALKGGPGITGRFSMSPSVTTSNKRHSCPPIPIHLQQKGSPGASSSPMSRKGFSPAGHLHKGSPHHHLHANSHHHEAHESSYVSEINGSKRSHMNSLMMFRMSCADTRLEEEAEPLPPNLCLEQVWQEQTTTIRYGLKGKSVFCFMSTDFNGISYLGYLVKGLSKLKLLKIHYGKFEKATEIECMDAGPLQPLKMYVVMDLSQNLHLYTGKQKIMSVCLPEPLQGVELGTLNLNQFVNGGFNISCCNNSERSARLQIPPLCQSDLVLSCIQSLKDILTSDEFNLVAAKYYCKLHHENTTFQSEWEVFIQVSIKLLGFPESSIKNIKENVSSPAPPEPKKAKKSDSYTGYEDWQYLMSCKPNKFVDDDVSKSMEKKYISDISLQKNAPLFNHVCAAFSLWHNLYEELKLNTLNTNLKEFAKFLHYLSEVFSLSSHVKIYETDFPCIKSKADTVYNLQEEFNNISEKCQQIKSFSLINHALDIFNNNNMDEPPPKHSHKMKYSTVLMKIFAAISKYTQSTSSSSDPEEMLAQLKLAGKESLVDTIINIMLKEGFTADDLDKLPIGYQIPIKEIFHHTRSTNQIAMSLETAMFLGREDIVSLKQLELNENTKLSSKLKPSHDEDDKDGMLIDEQMFEIRFKDDLRVHEVKRLLNSSVPVTVSVEQKPDMNDHAFAKEEESKLLILSKRTMSLSVARGMLTLGTAEPKSSKAVIIPTLDLSGRSSTSNKTVQIPQSDLNALLLWPNFHNGVAAGLKIARENCKVDSTWILLNKLKYSELNASHSGFLFALGLMGHLSSLPKLHLHDYLIKGHELTTVALLIGTAATKIGTKNTDAYKLLCLHLDSLLPPTALELNIPRISQTASALSLGLLFFGTGDLHLVKILLREIGKPPGVEIESSNDRESHALSAGLALGMIMIGQGTDNMKILDWDVFNLLYNYINRGKKNELIPGYNDSSQHQGSFQIFEGDTVNTDVTAPAAIMALALLYLKTNNVMVANSVKVIVSEATMDSLKPDHVLYRMLSFNLIMWDTLVPTLDWMEEILPGYAELLESLQSKSFLMVGWTQELYYRICAITGSFLALSLKFAASCNAHAFNMMLPWLKIIRKLRESSYSEEVGGKVILEQCLNTVLVSLSILMAGSGNITILKMARQLRKRTNDVSYGNHMAIHMAIGFLFLGGGRYTLKTDDIAIASLLCAVYPKWPISSKDNRFHLQALRHLYVLACEPRLFVTRDVDNKNICYTPIEVTLKETLNYPESRVKMLSPCFIPESKYIKKITTLGPRYLSIALTVPKKNNQLWLDQIQNIFVKKKAGYLSYAEDPKGFRNLLGRTFTNQSEKLECVKAFSSATNVVLFEEMFCHSKDGDKKYAEFFSNILYECVRQEKLDVLNRYLAIEKIIRDIENNRLSVYDFQQLRLLFSYYNNTHHKLLKMNYVSKTPLISGLYMMQCRIRCENQFQKIENLGFGSTRPLNFEIIKELSNSM